MGKPTLTPFSPTGRRGKGKRKGTLPWSGLRSGAPKELRSWRPENSCIRGRADHPATRKGGLRREATFPGSGWTGGPDPPVEYHAPMARRRLPVGIQTFREIRGEGCYYVDKTPFIRRLLDGGKHLLPLAPASFREEPVPGYPEGAVRGQRVVVRGARHSPRPGLVGAPSVVRLSFGSGHFAEPGGLRKEVADRLRTLEDAAAIVARHESAPARFPHLLEALHERTGRRVVVLVDEYDKPILDALEVPQVAGRTATTCAGSTPWSRTATRTSASASSPG